MLPTPLPPTARSHAECPRGQSSARKNLHLKWRTSSKSSCGAANRIAGTPTLYRPSVTVLLTAPRTLRQHWCSSKRLRLNAGKTEIARLGTTTNLNRLYADDKRMTIDPTAIEPSSVVRYLVMYFDAEVSVRDHVARTARTKFYHLRCLRAVQRQLGRDVIAQLDFCNLS